VTSQWPLQAMAICLRLGSVHANREDNLQGSDLCITFIAIFPVGHMVIQDNQTVRAILAAIMVTAKVIWTFALPEKE
jgi:hypothetical protein